MSSNTSGPYREPGPEPPPPPPPPPPPMPSALISWIWFASLGLVLAITTLGLRGNPLPELFLSAPIRLGFVGYLAIATALLTRVVRRHRDFWSRGKIIALAFYLALGTTTFVVLAVAILIFGFILGACYCSGRK